MSDEYNRSPYRENSPPLAQSASDAPSPIWPPHPENRPRQYSRSALRRQAFLCNLIDCVIPKQLASASHVRHHCVNGYYPNMIEPNTTIGGLKTHEEVDDWVVIHDTNSGHADVQVPAHSPPRLVTAPLKPRKRFVHLPSPGFEIQKVVGGGQAEMKWAFSTNMGVTSETSEQSSPADPMVRSAHSEKLEQMELDRFSNLGEFNWKNDEYEVELNRMREMLIGPTVLSDDGNSKLIVLENEHEDGTSMHNASSDSLNGAAYEKQGMDFDDTYEDEEEFDEEAWIASY